MDILLEMDDIDLRLCSLLMANCRTSYSRLANLLGISVPSVQRRIQTMRQENIIRGFEIRWSLSQKRAVPTMVSGLSKLPSEEIARSLARCDRVMRVFFSGQGRVHIDGVLRSASETEPYLEFVRGAASMNSLDTVVQGADAIAGGKQPMELSPLDLRIIVALKEDPRMQVKDLAKAVGITSKTATKRLDRLIDGGAIELTMLWAPTFSSGVVSVLEIHLREGADALKVRGEIASSLTSRMMGFALTGKRPESLLCMAWSPTAQSHADLVASLRAFPLVATVTSDILQTGCYFRSWLYDIPGR
jgi:DNA-binding Lrp family transcriptional regulator